jgi:uncharacterized protein YqhQ
MIRGRNHFSLAVRREDGRIERRCEPLSTLYTGRLRRIPLIRGMVVLLETLALGIKALHMSANMALQDQVGDGEGDVPGWVMGATLAVSLVLGTAVFFLLPLGIVWAIDPLVPSAILSEVIEGALRLVFLLGYMRAISFLPDIKRVFAYHGAEHMTVHAYEAGLPLNIANVRKFGTPHPRCGTAFLLTVVLVSVIVFAFLGRPDFEWRILSRIVLLPVIASVSYEIIRFSGVHQTWPIARALAAPGLLLQRLTTRQPDDGQIEVAITAMELAIAADAGREYPAGSPAPSETAGVQDGEPVSD